MYGRDVSGKPRRRAPHGRIHTVDEDWEHSGMGIAGRKIGLAIAGLGVAVIAAGVFAGGASAQEVDNEQGPERLECPQSSYSFGWQGNVDPAAEVISGDGTTFSDGTFTVTLSNAAPIDDDVLDYWHVGSVDFDANAPVSAIEMQLWQPGNTWTYRTVTFDPKVTAGTLVSPAGTLGEGQAPIKGLVFCFEKVAATTTTTTAAPTTTTGVQPEQIIATTTTPAPGPTVAPVEVLPQVETAPQQIAFTGSSSGPLVAIGAVLVLVGFSMVGVDRLGLMRRFRHSR
jgi:hypothetical protein